METNIDFDMDFDFFNDDLLDFSMKTARKKHPHFASSLEDALLVVQEELGEIVHAIRHGEGQDRIDDEILDLKIVVDRLYEQQYDGGDFRAYLMRMEKRIEM